MSTLFDTDEPATESPSGETIRALVDEFAYRADKVRTWTREKAETVLSARRKDARRSVNHGNATAATQEQEAEPPLFGMMHRLDAATCIEQARAEKDSDLLLFALVHAIYALRNGEMDDLAPVIVVQLRLDPVTGEPIKLPGFRGGEQ